MQFLKTLFWVMFAIVAVVFSMNNWKPVGIHLWGAVDLDIKLPILVFGAFLLGFLPTFGWHRASRWRLQRRIESHERALADMRGVDIPPAASPASLTPAPASTIEPPAQ
jgi:uncharacterized integral membrane protein